MHRMTTADKVYRKALRSLDVSIQLEEVYTVDSVRESFKSATKPSQTQLPYIIEAFRDIRVGAYMQANQHLDASKCIEFLIKWVDLGEKANTWVPIESITNPHSGIELLKELETNMYRYNIGSAEKVVKPRIIAKARAHFLRMQDQLLKCDTPRKEQSNSVIEFSLTDSKERTMGLDSNYSIITESNSNLSVSANANPIRSPINKELPEAIPILSLKDVPTDLPNNEAGPKDSNSVRFISVNDWKSPSQKGQRLIAINRVSDRKQRIERLKQRIFALSQSPPRLIRLPAIPTCMLEQGKPKAHGEITKWSQKSSSELSNPKKVPAPRPTYQLPAHYRLASSWTILAPPTPEKPPALPSPPQKPTISTSIATPKLTPTPWTQTSVPITKYAADTDPLIISLHQCLCTLLIRKKPQPSYLQQQVDRCKCGQPYRLQTVARLGLVLPPIAFKSTNKYEPAFPFYFCEDTGLPVFILQTSTAPTDKSKPRQLVHLGAGDLIRLHPQWTVQALEAVDLYLGSLLLQVQRQVGVILHRATAAVGDKTAPELN